MNQSLLLVTLLMLGCNNSTHRSKKNLHDSIRPPVIPKNVIAIPEGAVTADFKGNNSPIYGYVKSIDTQNQKTLIGFKNDELPQIEIPESVGAKLQALKLKSFNRDVLLVTAKLKDISFNEYYLFVLKDSVWQQPINRFDIHKSNMSDTLVPVQVNPKDSTQLLRYYSVFDMDRKSDKKYSWKLLRESITIEN